MYGPPVYAIGARTYWPAAGRFLQPDPERLESAAYGYANNPISRVDPDGGCWQMLTFALTGVGAAPSAVGTLGCIAAAWVVSSVATQVAVRGVPKGCVFNCASTVQRNRTYGLGIERLAVVPKYVVDR